MNCGFVVDGRERLLAGMIAETKAKIAEATKSTSNPEDLISRHETIEREAAQKFEKLDSPTNHY